jgi:hypothetical protein
VSPDGKKRASLNALRHGLTGATALLPGEDPEEFASFLADYIDELVPQGRFQQTLVAEIAADSWRMGRIAAYEAGAIRLKIASLLREEIPGYRQTPMTREEMEHRGVVADDIADAVLVLDKDQGFLTLKLPRYQRALARRRERNLALLFTLQARSAREEARREPEALETQSTSNAGALDPIDVPTPGSEPSASQPVTTPEDATLGVTVSGDDDDRPEHADTRDASGLVPGACDDTPEHTGSD